MARWSSLSTGGTSAETTRTPVRGSSHCQHRLGCGPIFCANSSQSGCAPPGVKLICPEQLARARRRYWFPSIARFENVQSVLRAAGYNDTTRLPPILVLGVGHSGTSTVACELLELSAVPGQFSKPSQGDPYCEDKSTVEVNEMLCFAMKWPWCSADRRRQHVDWSQHVCRRASQSTQSARTSRLLVYANPKHARMRAAHLERELWSAEANVTAFFTSRAMASPSMNSVMSRLRFNRGHRLEAHPNSPLRWQTGLFSTFTLALKDPRFVWTLHLWRPALHAAAAEAKVAPLLLHVRRAPADVLESYVKRDEMCFRDAPTPQEAIASRTSWARWQLEQWCGPSISIDIASLGGRIRQNHCPKSMAGRCGMMRPLRNGAYVRTTPAAEAAQRAKARVRARAQRKEQMAAVTRENFNPAVPGARSAHQGRNARWTTR